MDEQKNGKRIMQLRDQITKTLKGCGHFNEVMMGEMSLAALAFAIELAFEAGMDAKKIGYIATAMEEMRERLRAQVLDAEAQKLADALKAGDEATADKAADAILRTLLGPAYEGGDCDCPRCEAKRRGTDPNVEAVGQAAAAGFVAGTKN